MLVLVRRRLTAAWLVVLAGVSGAFHIGVIAPAIPALQDQLGMSLLQAGWLLSLVLLAGAVLGLAIGTIADTFGLRRTLLTGLVVMSAAGAASGLARSVEVLLVLRAVEGIGFMLTVVPAPGLIRRLVDERYVTRMLGVWGAYIAVGTGLALLVGPLVIDGAGWPWWWWAVASGSAAMALAVAVAVPSDGRMTLTGSATGPSAGRGLLDRMSLTLRTPGPWLAALTFALYASQWMAVIGFLPTLYAQAGWTGATGALLSGMVPLVNALGSLAAGWCLHRGWGTATLVSLGLAGQALGAVLAFAPLTADAAVLRYAGALCFSAVGGLVPGTLFALAPRIAPTEHTVSTTVGLIQQATSLGQLLGPPVVAWFVGRVGGWEWTWAITLASTVVGTMSALVLQATLRHASPPAVPGPRVPR